MPFVGLFRQSIHPLFADHELEIALLSRIFSQTLALYGGHRNLVGYLVATPLAIPCQPPSALSLKILPYTACTATLSSPGTLPFP